MDNYLKRPILILLLFNIVGILSQYLNFLFIGFFVVFISVIFLMNYNVKIYFLILCIISFFLGINLTFNSMNDINKLSELNGTDITITGEVITKNDKKAYVKTDTINGEKSRYKLVIRDIGEVEVGDKVEVMGKFYTFKEPYNFNGFNELLYESTKKAKGKIIASEVETIKLGNKLKNKILNKLNKNIDNSILYENRELVRAMILGIDDDLNDETIDNYRNGGIYHILAISGLHIGIIYLFLYSIFKNIKFLRNKTYLIIFILMYYSYLTGNSTSTVRAVIMCSLLILSHYVYRFYDIQSALYFVALIFLIYNPFLLFSIGFIYGFTSVLAIALWSEIISEKIFNISMKNDFTFNVLNQQLRNNISATIAVTIAITPISIYFFNTFNPYAIFTNILIMPFITILVISSFLVTILGNISIVTLMFKPIIFVILSIFNIVLNFINSLPYAEIVIKTPKLYVIILYYYLFYIFMEYLKYNKNVAVLKKLFIVFISILFISIYYPKDTLITFISDTYDKSLNIVINDNDKAILISNDKTPYMYNINNYLKHIGVDEITYYINFSDIVYDEQNIQDNINNQNVNTLLIPVNSIENSSKIEYNSKEEFLKKNGIEVVYIKPNDEIWINDNTSIKYIENENIIIIESFGLKIYLLDGDGKFNFKTNIDGELNYYDKYSGDFTAFVDIDEYDDENVKYINLDKGDIQFNINEKRIKVKTVR